jgi:hypothetical protein
MKQEECQISGSNLLVGLHGYKKDNKTDCSTHAEMSLLLITFKILLNIPDILIHKIIYLTILWRSVLFADVVWYI